MKRTASVALVLGAVFVGATASAILPATPNLAGPWTTTSIPVANGPPGGSGYLVAFMNGAFYATGGVYGANNNALTLDTSPDGLTWRQVGTMNLLLSPPPQVPPGAYAMGFNNGTYFAGFQQGGLMASKDGATWTLQNSTTNQGLTGFACSPTACVFSSNTMAVVSNDMLNWSRATAGAYTDSFLAIAYGNGLFAMVTQVGRCNGCGPGTGFIYTSPDGRTWKKAATTTGLNGITWGSSGFVGVGIGGGYSTSPDGVTWTNGIIAGVGYSDLKDVAFGAGTYCAVGTGPVVYTMPAGSTTWTSRGVTAPGANLYHVAFGANRFVATGYSPSQSAIAVTSASLATLPVIANPPRSLTGH